MAGRFSSNRLLYSKNWGAKYLFCVIDVFTKYACVKPLKGKITKPVFNGFIKIANESKSQPNKLWIDQVKEFCNNFMEKWLDGNDFNILDF